MDPYKETVAELSPPEAVSEREALLNREARAVPGAFVEEGAYDKRRGSLRPRGGLGVGKVD